MSHIEERLDHVRALIQEPEFLEGKGFSNEVNIRIFCYEPEDEMAVRPVSYTHLDVYKRQDRRYKSSCAAGN